MTRFIDKLSNGMLSAMDRATQAENALRAVLPYALSRIEDLTEFSPSDPLTVKAAAVYESAAALVGEVTTDETPAQDDPVTNLRDIASRIADQEDSDDIDAMLVQEFVESAAEVVELCDRFNVLYGLLNR